MAKYIAIVHYEGSIPYVVEADSQDEAEQKAAEMFWEEDNNDVAQNIGEVKVCDCQKQ